MSVKYSTRCLAAVLVTSFVLGVSACGGGAAGSSSGSGSSNNPSNSSGGTPATQYTGKTTEALLSVQQGPPLAATLLYDASYTSVITGVAWSFLQAQLTTTNTTATLSLTNRSFNFTSNGPTYDASGTLTVRYLPNDPTPATYEVDFDNYHVTGSGVDVVLNGSVDYSVEDDTFVLNVGVQDNNAQTEEEFQDFTITSNLAPQGLGYDDSYARTFSGRAYDQNLGYVVVSTTGQEYFGTDPADIDPLAGGDFVMTDSSAKGYHLAPLNYYFFSDGIDTDGDGQVDESTRYLWSSLGPDTTSMNSQPLLALAVQSTTAYVGQPASVDGQFSHAVSGDMLQFQWSLKYAPPGSAASLSDADTHTASFVPDIAGDYLLQLTVTDGTNTASDVVSVTAVTSRAAVTPLFGHKAGPDISGQVGVPVQLDGRAATVLLLANNNDYTLHGGQPSFQWTLDAPPGSTAALDDASSATPTFTPDVPGYYLVTVEPVDSFESEPVITDFGGVSSVGNLSNEEIISVGADVHFDTEVQLDASQYTNPSVYVADLNNDGKPDIVVANDLADVTEPSSLSIYINNGHGGFNQPIVLSNPGYHGDSTITVGDLNGDGLPDIAVLVDGGVEVYLQNSDGSWNPGQILSYANCDGTPTPPIWIGKLFGETSNSLLVEACANIGYFAYSGGNFTALTTVISGLTGSQSFVLDAVADVTGDGIADLIGNDGNIIYPGQHGGTFGTRTSSTGGSSYVVTDMNGDGFNDAVCEGCTSANNLDIYFGSSTGLASTPVSYPITNRGGYPLVIGDVNGDGLPDVLNVIGLGTYTPYDNYYLGIVEQKSDHTFLPEVFYPTLSALGPNVYPQPVWVADFDGDGVPDILTVEESGIRIYFGHR